MIYKNEKADVYKTLDPNLKNQVENLYYFD